MASVIQKIVPLLATSFLLLSAASETFAANNNGRGRITKKDTATGNLRASVKPSGSLQFYYPDVTLKGCRSSGNKHLTTWMEQNTDNGYLFHDLKACCSTRFDDNVDGCLEASRGVNDTNEGKVGTTVEVINSETSTFQMIDTSRRLAKSGKSNKSGKQGKYYKPSNPWKNPPNKPKQKGPRPPHPQKPRPVWQKPPQQNKKPNNPWQKPPQQKKPHYHNHGPHWHSPSDGKSGKSAKSGKSSKAKSSKSKHYHPVKPKPRTRNPTRKPTPMPVGSKLVEITMGGLLTAHNLNVPPPGSQELSDLAEVFEKTIMAVLDDDYVCDVTNIGGIPVDIHFDSSSDEEGVGMFTRSLQSSDVLFHCKVIKPCPGDCTSTQAIMLASRVFDETFEELGEKAKSGELTVIFCIFAEVAKLVSEPCEVTITSVEGTSLDVNYVDGPPSTPKPSKKPSPMPTLPKIPGTPAPTPKPTPMPVKVTDKPSLMPVKATDKPNPWPPTPMPTDKPAVGTTPPTTYEPTPTSSGTYEPTTMSPVLVTTSTSATTSSAATTTGTSSTTSGTTTSTTTGESSVTTTTTSATDITTDATTTDATTTDVTTTDATTTDGTTTDGTTTAATTSATATTTVDRGITASPSVTPTDPPVPGAGSKSPTLSPVVDEIPITPTGSPVDQSGSVVPTPSASYPTLMPTGVPTGDGATIIPTTLSPKTPTNAPVPSSTPPHDGGSTISPTSIPPGATFYDGFETGSFGFPGSDAEWSTEGDGLWRHTTEQAASGKYSVRSPELDNPDLIPLSSNLTLTLGESYGPGTLVFSILSSVEMPFDNLAVYVDGEIREQFMGMTSFEVKQLVLGPGAHTIIFQYAYNPAGLEFFPPASSDRIGASFIDDVYFLPVGQTVEPTAPPVPGPMTQSPVPGPETTDPPTPAIVPSAPSTIAPTPEGALYFDGFEEGTFPDDPEWNTKGDGLWELTTERVKNGRYSIRSPDLSNDEFTPGFSNVTLSTNPAWMGGTVVLSILAGVSMPYDGLIIYVDDVTRGQLSDKTKFEQLKIEIGPGPHEITFAYAHNPVDLDALPPKPDGVEHVGGVFIDDVYFLPIGVTVAPTEVKTPSPTISASPTVNQDTDSPTPAMTISPTSTPEGALYYDSFEQGTFPNDPEWSVEGDGDWVLTKERSTSGVFSIKSPDFFGPEDTTQKTANVTLSTNPQWPSGKLHFSVFSGLNMPYDDLAFYVDGEMRGQANEMTEFESRTFQLSPGPHQIVFSYRWNPVGVDAFPPVPDDRIGAAFIDDVYFMPDGAVPTPPAPTPSGTTSSPSMSPVVPEIPTQPTGRPVAQEGSETPTYSPSQNPTVGDGPETPVPTPPPIDEVPTTIAPTSIPENSVYYDGFEQATFPNDPEWSTSGDGVWELTTETAHSGIYSIRSPDLTFLKSGTSSVVLSLDDPDFEGGSLVASIIAGVELPIDSLAYYLDGDLVNEMSPQLDWEAVEIPLGPGPHEIRFEYRYNPFGLDALPPASASHLGAVFIDDVYILPYSDNFFDGFESGDFTGLDWVKSGEDAWVVDDTNAFEGTYSAHVRTVDISSENYGQLDLEVTAASAAFVQFYFYAPVAMPFEKFDLLIDGQFLTGLATVDETWAQAGAIISAGEHVVSWRLSNNPGGAPVDMLNTIPPPPFRQGEAWLDNVQLLPSTPSFVETWASGDFTAHPWELAGDADWSITDSSAYVGTYSATVSSDDIAESSGFSHLSMDIITEQGGMLKFQIRPLVEGPFDFAHVLIDDIKVFEYLNMPASPESWLAQELTIQPGKRKVTFELIKNPGQIPDEAISNYPPIPGHEGRVYLDEIVFEANVEGMMSS